MIAFASLFLGLVLGNRPVEVVVGDEVATVQILLDGHSIGVLRGAPWRLDCDFGDALTPHHLEAIALDGDGNEISRVEQWLNLPQPSAVATVLIDSPDQQGVRTARLSWESAAGALPESVEVSLDGAPLESGDLVDEGRMRLPPVNENQLHVLTVELEFDDRVTSRVDLAFGGAYADAVETQITAVAIAARGKRSPPAIDAMQEWFSKGGEPLRVLAVEKERAEIILVVDRAFPRLVEPGKRSKTPKTLALAGKERFRLVTTRPERSQGVATSFELFPISSAYSPSSGNLYALLTSLLQTAQSSAPRPGSAVAVAGLAAYGSRLRRAVVLLPSSRAESAVEDLPPTMTQHYLDVLGVPMFVWNPDSRPLEHLAGWRNVRSVGSFDKLSDAFIELRGQLEAQWIVWLEGRHLPQQIVLSSAVADFELVGAGADRSRN